MEISIKKNMIPPQINKFMKTPTNLIRIAYILSTLITLLSVSTILLSKYSFIFDLFSHFQFQYLLVMIVFLIFFAVTKQYLGIGLLSTYIIFLCAFYILPVDFLPLELNEKDIFYMNTKYANKETNSIIKEIEKTNPKIIALVEPNQKLIQKLTEIHGQPILQINSGTNSYAIFTEQETIESKIIKTGDINTCYIDFGDYILLTVHALDPLSFTKRDINLEFLAKLNQEIVRIEEKGKKFILVGDFNNTYYSGTFRQYFKKYFKKNIYSWEPFKPWSIPIDHALTNTNIAISRTKKLSSDHTGLIIDIL